MPLLIDGGTIVPEATVIIEYLKLHFPGPTQMILDDPKAALDVRLLDRMSDNYVMTPTQTIVFDPLRKKEDRDPFGVKQTREMLDGAYAWWNAHMTGRKWAAEEFGLAECATAPALFYADRAHPISKKFGALCEYRARLLARPSVARAVDEARPFRSGFPLGDPGRD